MGKENKKNKETSEENMWQWRKVGGSLPHFLTIRSMRSKKGKKEKKREKKEREEKMKEKRKKGK